MQELLKHYQDLYDWSISGVQNAEKRIESIIENMEREKGNFDAIGQLAFMLQDQFEARSEILRKARVWKKAIAAFDAE
jgi:HEPN domain-containing protein